MLVVDDNKDAACSPADIGQLLRFGVRTACGEAAALEVARQDRPRAVFLDIAMPEMNGPAVLRQLRQLRQLPGGQAIFVTAVTGYGADDEKAGRVSFARFDAWLQKPPELADLQALLASAQLEGKG